MKLKLKQTTTNQHSIVGVFIQGDSMLKCLNELVENELDLSLNDSYIIPDASTNEMLGLLLVLKNGYNKDLFNKHIPVLSVLNKVYIHAGTTISPMVTSQDLNTVFNDSFVFIHPQIGLVQLNEKVVWTEIVKVNLLEGDEVVKPIKGKQFPNGVKSFVLDVQYDKVLDELEKSPYGNVLDNGHPHFDYEKLLKGNKKELEKFLKLLEKNPSLAMKYAIPLDTLNKARVTNYTSFKFDRFEIRLRNFMSHFFNKETIDKVEEISGEKKLSSVIFPILLTSIVVVVLFYNLNSKSMVNDMGVPFIAILVVVLLLLVFFANYRKSKPSTTLNSSNISRINKVSKNNHQPIVPANEKVQTPRQLEKKDTSNVNDNKNNAIYIYLFVIIVLLLLLKDFIGAIPAFFIFILRFTAVLLVLLGVYYMIKKFLKSREDKASERRRKNSSALMDSESFKTIEEYYKKMAQTLINQNDYKQAANIYNKLLGNPMKAAEVLKEGKLYQEAAVIYLKKCNDKSNAAECFELAKAYKNALDLYLQLKEDEKVGDMYVLLHQMDEALKHYKIKYEELINKHMYLTAAKLANEKMLDMDLTQSTLLKGWEMGNEKEKCLYQYFQNVDDLKARIVAFYNEQVKPSNSINFLQVIKKLKKVNSGIDETSLELAYKIISSNAKLNSNLVSELLSFTEDDAHLENDVFRFKNKHNKKKYQ